MAIVALLLWLFTAAAGISMLVRSNLGQARPSEVPQEMAAPVSATLPATGSLPAAGSLPGAGPSPVPAQARQATRGRFDPPSLVASRAAPVVPGSRALLEFAHPACGIVGLGFWMGFTFVHARILGWIALGLITVTACLGLAWFAANHRAARRQGTAISATRDGEPAPSFRGRLVAVHGAAAGLTFVLAALSALVLKG